MSLRSSALVLLLAGTLGAQEPPPPATEPPPPAEPAKPGEKPAQTPEERAKADAEKKEIGDALARQRDFGEKGRRIVQLEQELAAATEWVQKAILCVELADLLDRRAVPALARALGDDELMVQAFALHGLARLPDVDVKRGGGAPLVSGLIDVLKARAHYHRRVARALLVKVVGEDLGAEPGKWKSWLKKNEATLTVEAPPAPDLSKYDAARVAQVEKERSDGGTSVRPRIPPVASEIRELNKAGLDVVLCLDQTGSMGHVLAEAKARLQLLTLLIGLVVKDYRFGLITYDDGLKVFEPLTADVAALRATLDKVQAAGGGDIPEGVDKALENACRADAGWRKRSVKTVIIVGDAPPHEPDMPATLARAGSMKGELRIVVHAVSTGHAAVPQLEKIAEAGGGRSLLLGQPERLVSEVLLLIFGETLRPAMERFVPILMEIHEEERAARGGR